MKKLIRIVMVSCAYICARGVADAAPPVPITIVVFTPPSLGSILSSVIKKQKFDLANGLDIKFAERTPDAYATEFNSGEFQVGGSASVLIQALANTRGVKTSYLFNLFDYWGAVVTSRPDIRTLADLRGKDIAAAKGTTNYTMFEWFVRQQGVDPKSFKVLNTAPAGLLGYALADRADAVELWEPAYSLLLARKPGIRTLDLHIRKVWRAFAGSDKIPNLGVAAHRGWIARHRDLIEPLYRSYKQAADWVIAHPNAASSLVGPVKSPADRKALAQMIRDNSQLVMDVSPASDMKREIAATYRMGKTIGLLKTTPGPSAIYNGKLQ